MADSPESNHQLAIPPKNVADYIPSVKIITESGAQVNVPVNSEANRLQSQVVASEMREFLASQIKKLKDADLKPKDVKSLAEAWSIVEENAKFAYAPALTAEESGETGTTPAQLVKAMAEGISSAHIKSESGRMEKVLSLGKSKDPNPIIELKSAS